MNISQEPRSRIWNREHGGMPLPVSCSPCSGSPVQGWHYPQWADSPISIINQENYHRFAYRAIYMGIFPWAYLQYLAATKNVGSTIPWATVLKWIKREKWRNWGKKQHYWCLVTVTILWPEVSPLHLPFLTSETPLS